MKKELNDGSIIYVGTYGPLKDEWRYKGVWVDASHEPTDDGYITHNAMLYVEQYRKSTTGEWKKRIVVNKEIAEFCGYELVIKEERPF